MDLRLARMQGRGKLGLAALHKRAPCLQTSKAANRPVGRGCRAFSAVSMAKRGPKSERRAAKAKKQPAEGSSPAPAQQQQPQQQRQQPPQQQPRQRQEGEQVSVAQQGVAAPGDGAITVGDRILPRILLFSGIPVALGLLTLPGFYYLKVVKGLEIPTFVVYIASFLFFGSGLAGISYGIFSSSWDPSRQGSAGGLDEFKENVEVFKKRREF